MRHGRHNVRYAAVVIAALTACGLARADAIWTARGRLAGRVQFSADRPVCAGTAVAWSDVVLLSLDAGGRTISAPNALRLVTGEIVPAELVRAAARKVRIVSPVFGEREIDQSQVAALEFLAAGRSRGGNEPRTYYRKHGPPVPGALLWADAARLGIETPLGIITVGREGALRYVFSADEPAEPGVGEDELLLADGASLRGRVRCGDGRVIIEHAVLGEAAVPAAAVRLVRRNLPGVRHLRRITVARRELAAPPGPQIQAFENERPAIVVHAPCAAQLGSAGGFFRAFVRPAAGNRSEARVRIVAGGAAVMEKVLAPGSAGEAISCAVPPESPATLEVEPATAGGFPCALEIAEAHYAAAPPSGGRPTPSGGPTAEHR